MHLSRETEKESVKIKSAFTISTPSGYEWERQFRVQELQTLEYQKALSSSVCVNIYKTAKYILKSKMVSAEA